MFTTTAANLAAQRQAALFEECPDDFELSPAPALQRWQGHRGLFGRNDRWTHPGFPGITVHHCGHPTALRPYYVTGHSALEGSTYQNLKAAQEAAATPNRKDRS